MFSFNRVEFSDLYKFLTSIGLLLLVSSLVIPWLFISPDNLVSIEQQEYESLIESSRKLVDEQIDTTLRVLKLLPVISILVFLTGLTLTIVGIYKWYQKQKILDKLDLLDLKERSIQVQDLDAQEIDNKAAKEVESELAVEDLSSKTERKENVITDKEVLKHNLLNMEELIFKKITDYNYHKYEPKANVKLGSDEMDIVLKSSNPPERPDVLIEVKYLQNRLNMQTVRDGFNKLRSAYSHVLKQTRNAPKGILIVVYRSEVVTEEELSRFNAAVTEMISAPVHQKYFRIETMSDKEIQNLEITSLVNE